ncbi:MAG: VOC family protein [Kofleriaceae bacterium]
MDFTSVRIITADAKRLVAFYEHVTGGKATWFTPDFAEVTTTGATLAVANEVTVGLFGNGVAKPAANQSVILEWRVDDVDAAYERVKPDALVQAPTTMPWGNRSLLFPGSRWQSRQPVHTGHAGGAEEV